MFGGGPVCVVPGCKNVGNHLIPKNIENRLLWMKAMRLEGQIFKTKYPAVCSLHFKETDYIDSDVAPLKASYRKRRTLKRHAVPSIFCWNEPPTKKESTFIPVEEGNLSDIEFDKEKLRDPLLGTTDDDNINVMKQSPDSNPDNLSLSSYKEDSDSDSYTVFPFNISGTTKTYCYIKDTMTKVNKVECNAGNVLNFDHLIFRVANAKMASSYFVTRLGFSPLAVRESTEDMPIVSHVVKLNKISIVFESPTAAGGAVSEDLTARGDFVKDVAFEVDNLVELVKRAEAGGAEVVTPITEESDDGGVVKYAVLKTYGDNTHTLIDRTKYTGVFLPGYKAIDEEEVLNKLLPDIQLEYIDHVEGNMTDGTLESSLMWYEKNLNMNRFWCVDYEHELTPWSCINSGSVTNEADTVLLSMNEAAKGQRPTSKATEFVKAHGASGVEHVALYTDDIVATIKNLKARGAEIQPFPAAYYELIREKLSASSLEVTESIAALQEHHILIDFDEKGYMLQAFTKHLQARPTLFIELIQRRNHRGFGSMNYKWVFEAIQGEEKSNEEEK